VAKDESARSPKLYTPGLLRIYYTHFGFVVWMFEAVWLALLCVFVPSLAFGYPGVSLASPTNGDPCVASISLSAMVLVCVGVNLRLAIEMHSWHVLEHLFLWGSIIAIEIAALIFSYVWYPSSLPASFDWNQLHAVVTYTWSTLAYWLASFLAIVLSLSPRMISLANDAVTKGRAARRRRRIVISRQRKETERSADQLHQAQMAVPSHEEINRYRCASDNGLSTVSSVGVSADGATPGGARRRGTQSFAFSNDDRSSLSVLASFGRVSLGKRPVDV